MKAAKPGSFGTTRGLARAPAQVIAEITAGIARQRDRHARRARSGKQAARRHRQRERRRAGGGDAARLWRDAGCVGDERESVAGARLDADIRRPCRQPEHQHGVGFVFAQKRRQLTIHRRIAGRKDMRNDSDAGERRPAQLRQPCDQRPGWIEWRAGKRPEAGDEDGGHYASFVMPALVAGIHAFLILLS